MNLVSTQSVELTRENEQTKFKFTLKFTQFLNSHESTLHAMYILCVHESNLHSE